MVLHHSNSDRAKSSHDAFAIPDYLLTKPDGLYVTLADFHSGASFAALVGEIFSNNLLFEGLHYDIFLSLMYDADWLAAMREKCAEVKIATGIAAFPAHRAALYKTVKVLERGKHAEYVFEPVSVLVTIDEPVYGEPDANGVAPVIRHVSSQTMQPGTLNIDEFVAAMWSKGIRYGIQTEQIRKIIAERTSGRNIVALWLPPQEGKDADILEVCPDLHRDNSPKTLLNGKADMRAFQNRFPHIAKGEHLLKKVPRVLGKIGYKVTGELVEPDVPKDLNLLALASTGTTAVLEKDGDYLVAQMDGFLNIDPVTNTISITEKIETTAGVSMKTTGDLALNVEEFVEHGEVQEGRVVKGRSMTFKANVYGNLISTSGNIIVDGNLTGGTAEASNGNVTLSRASRSTVHALKGEVIAGKCENCLIVAQKINVVQAVNCILIADEISAENTEGCMLAAISLRIASSADSKSRETLITMIVPDLTRLNQRSKTLQEKTFTAQEEKNNCAHEIDQLKLDPDLAKFIALYNRIKSGEIKLTSDQAENWKKLVAKNTRAWNQLEALNKKIISLDLMQTEFNEELAQISQIRDAAGANISCVIDNITGLTRGQTLTSLNGLQNYSSMSENDIKMALQQADQRQTIIFSADAGSVNWHYQS
jgi:uncharacterized protein (DUF342 family)